MNRYNGEAEIIISAQNSRQGAYSALPVVDLGV